MIRIRWNWPALIDDGQIRIALLLPKLRSKANFSLGFPTPTTTRSRQVSDSCALGYEFEKYRKIEFT